jgi:hypothetical protein
VYHSTRNRDVSTAEKSRKLLDSCAYLHFVRLYGCGVQPLLASFHLSLSGDAVVVLYTQMQR